MAAPAKVVTMPKPRLNSLDDLLKLNENTAHLAVDSADEPKAPPANTEYGIVAFSLMDDYPEHMFSLYTGQRKEDMVESIRKNGILQPLILRAKDDGRFTILAGHNRRYNGEEAGFDEGPAIMKALLDIPCIKILMGTDGQNLMEIKKLYNLTEAEEELLAAKKRAHALMIVGSKRLHVHFEIPAYKFDYMGKAGGR